jgi:secreted trypsin-like serine protease
MIYFASFIGPPDDREGIQCTGSIINNRYFITAAHCFPEGDVTTRTVYAFHTTQDLKTEEIKKPSNRLGIKRVIKHPGYTWKHSFNDIALVEIEKAFIFNSTFVPVCLEDSKRQLDNLVVVGFGSEESGYSVRNSLNLKEAKMTVLSDEDCINSYSGLAVLQMDKAICAGGETNICHGDSGGPLMTSRSGQLLQVGISSFSRTDCGVYTKTPAVFERISAHNKWIQEHTRGSQWCH